MSNNNFIKNFYFDINTNNLIRRGTINEDSNEISNQHILNIKLYPYQKKVIKKMEFMENGGKYYFGSNYIKTNIGILGNKIGSGKSICILERIIKKTSLHENSNITKSIDNIINIGIFQKHVLKTNLIVIKKHLLNQWTYYIKHYTNLNYNYIVKKNTISLFEKSILENKNDILIITDSVYKHFANHLSKKYDTVVFSRIIYDNIDDLDLKKCPKINNNFMWFVTSKPENLIFLNNIVYNLNCENENMVNENNFKELISNQIINWNKYVGLKNRGYIYKIFCKIYNNRFYIDYNSILVKCSDSLISKYTRKSKIITLNYNCSIPKYLNYSIKYGLINKKDMDIEGVFNINRVKMYVNHHHLINNLKKYSKNINRINEVNKVLTTKNYQNTSCPICYDNIRRPLIITPCCHQIFHIECLFKTYKNMMKCPYCISDMNILDCFYLDKLELNKKIPNKIDQIIKILNNVKGRCLVYISSTNYEIIKKKFKNSILIDYMHADTINNCKNNIFFLYSCSKIKGLHNAHFDNIIITKSEENEGDFDILKNISVDNNIQKKINMFTILYSNCN